VPFPQQQQQQFFAPPGSVFQSYALGPRGVPPLPAPRFADPGYNQHPAFSAPGFLGVVAPGVVLGGFVGQKQQQSPYGQQRQQQQQQQRQQQRGGGGHNGTTMWRSQQAQQQHQQQAAVAGKRVGGEGFSAGFGGGPPAKRQRKRDIVSPAFLDPSLDTNSPVPFLDIFWFF
jgi:hypothetical protein